MELPQEPRIRYGLRFMSMLPRDYLEPAPPPNKVSAWMLTFVDLLSLILTFFVMLYAATSMQETQWKKVASSLTDRLNPDKTAHGILLDTDGKLSVVEIKEAIDLRYLYSLISQKIEAQEAFSGIRLYLRDSEVAISLPDDIIFQDNNELSPEALNIMALLEDIFHQIGNRVDVYAYIDTKSEEWDSSGWELSLVRASAVAGGLQKFGYSYPMQVFGLPGAHKENIAVPTGEGKKELYVPSRRVDIVVRNEKAGGTL